MSYASDTQNGLLRLDNWSRWNRRGEIAEIRRHYYPGKAAVCGNYLPEAGEVWAEEIPIPVDIRDAELVEKLVLALPIQLKKAVTHYYFGRPSTIGISNHTLREWLDQAARLIAINNSQNNSRNACNTQKIGVL